MHLYKSAPMTALGHSTLTVTEASAALPNVEDAYADGARSIIIQNSDSLGASVWVALDGSEAAVDHGLKLETMHRIEITLDDIRKVRVIAPPTESCKLSVSYFR